MTAIREPELRGRISARLDELDVKCPGEPACVHSKTDKVRQRLLAHESVCASEEPCHWILAIAEYVGVKVDE